MSEAILPFQLCLKNMNGEDVTVQIDPGETFQQFIDKTVPVLGYNFDVNSITNGDDIDLNDDMYTYLLKIDEQISDLGPMAATDSENIVLKNAGDDEDNNGTIYVWEDGTPIDPSLITFENGVAVLNQANVELDATESDDRKNSENVEYDEKLLQQNVEYATETSGENTAKENIQNVVGFESDNFAEDKKLVIAETAHDEAANATVQDEPSDAVNAVHPETGMQARSKKRGTKVAEFRRSAGPLNRERPSDDGKLGRFNVLNSKSKKTYMNKHEYKRNKSSKEYLCGIGDNYDKARMKHRFGKNDRDFKKWGYPFKKSKLGKYVGPKLKNSDSKLDGDISKSEKRDYEDVDNCKDEAGTPQKDADGTQNATGSPGKLAANANIPYKLVPSSNSDFAAQFSQFLGAQWKTDSCQSRVNLKSSVKIKSIQRAYSKDRNGRLPPLQDMEEEIDKSKKVKEGNDPQTPAEMKKQSAESLIETPKITQYKIVAPYSLKSRYGSPPAASPPRKAPPVNVKRSVPNILDDLSEDEYVDYFDFCHFCVRLLMTEEEKAFVMKLAKAGGRRSDPSNHKLAKVLCEGCLNRGYVELRAKSDTLGSEEIYVIKNGQHFVYKRKSPLVKRKREIISYGDSKIPFLQKEAVSKAEGVSKMLESVKKKHQYSDSSDEEESVSDDFSEPDSSKITKANDSFKTHKTPKAKKFTSKSDKSKKLENAPVPRNSAKISSFTRNDTIEKHKDKLAAEMDLELDDLLVERKGKSVICTYNTETKLKKASDNHVLLEETRNKSYVPKIASFMKKKFEPKKQSPRPALTPLMNVLKQSETSNDEVFVVDDGSIHQFKIVDINKITGGKIKPGLRGSLPANDLARRFRLKSEKPVKIKQESERAKLKENPLISPLKINRECDFPSAPVSKIKEEKDRITPKKIKEEKPMVPVIQLTKVDEVFPVKSASNDSLIVRPKRAHKINQKYESYFSKFLDYRQRQEAALALTPKSQKVQNVSVGASPKKKDTKTVKGSTPATPRRLSSRKLKDSVKLPIEDIESIEIAESATDSRLRSDEKPDAVVNDENESTSENPVIKSLTSVSKKSTANLKRKLDTPERSFRKKPKNGDNAAFKNTPTLKVTPTVKIAPIIKETLSAEKTITADDSFIGKEDATRGDKPTDEDLAGEKVAPKDGTAKENNVASEEHFLNNNLDGLVEDLETNQNHLEIQPKEVKFEEKKASPEEYCCRICGKQIQHITLVVSHSIHHQDIEKKEFPCVLCTNSYQNYRMVSMHMKKEHGGVQISELSVKKESSKTDNAVSKAAGVTSSRDEVASGDGLLVQDNRKVSTNCSDDDDDDVTRALKSMFGFNEQEAKPAVVKPTAAVKPTAVEKLESTVAKTKTASVVDSPSKSETTPSESKKEPELILGSGPPSKAETELVQALLAAYDVLDLDAEILEQLKSNLLKTIRVTAMESKNASNQLTDSDQTLDCLLCREKFKSPSDLKMHECNVEKTKKTAEDARLRMEMHRSQLRPVERVHVCVRCGQARKTLSRLKFHLRFHEPPYLYQRPIEYSCRLCTAPFPGEEQLFQHMELCHFCDIRARTLPVNKSLNVFGGVFVGQHRLGTTSLSRRERRARSKVMLPTRCSVCLRKVPRKTLQSHLEEHRPQYKEDFVFYCQICLRCFHGLHPAEKHAASSRLCLKTKERSPSSFRNRGNFDDGTVTQDIWKLRRLYEGLSEYSQRLIGVRSVRVAYKCEFCDATYMSKAALREHRKTHDPTKSTYFCEWCCTKFPAHGSLMSHLITDCERRPSYLRNPRTLTRMREGTNLPLDSDFPVRRLFLCSDCDKTFLHWAYLKAHKRICHTKFTFKCDQCAKVFCSRWSVDHHKKSSHVQVPLITEIVDRRKRSLHSEAPSRSKLFRCGSCNYETPIESALSQHWRTAHNGFACSFCGMKFATKRWMEFHEKSHESQKSFSCIKCSMSFSRSELLRSHVLSVHKDKIEYTCIKCPRSFQSEEELQLHFNRRHSLGIPLKNPPMVIMTKSETVSPAVSKGQTIGDMSTIPGIDSAARVMPRITSQKDNFNVRMKKDKPALSFTIDKKDRFDMSEYLTNLQSKSTSPKQAKGADPSKTKSTINSGVPEMKPVTLENVFRVLGTSPTTRPNPRINTYIHTLSSELEKEILGSSSSSFKLPSKTKVCKKSAAKSSRGVYNMIEKPTTNKESVTKSAISKIDTNGVVMEDFSAVGSKSMDIGDVLTMLESGSTKSAGSLAMPQRVDIRDISLSSTLPIVINESGTLNVVLDQQSLEGDTLAGAFAEDPQQSVHTLRIMDAVEADGEEQQVPATYIIENMEQKSEVIGASQSTSEGTVDDELSLVHEGSAANVFGDNIVIVDEDGKPVSNSKVQVLSDNVIVTSDGHIVINGDVFKLDMKEGTELDLENIAVRQDEDGQIILETTGPESGLALQEEQPEWTET